MLDAMRHRGPDGRGTLSFAGGAAGMVRLALVDLSDRGQQPLWSPDRRVAVLFNGEMYNFRQERQRLEGKGYVFRTTTDTEVILNLYLERGPEFVHRLRGMDAIAILDWRERPQGGLPTLLLSRGPLGIKPLYIAPAEHDTQCVLFASEVRALLASGLVARQVSQAGLSDYLSRGFVVQPTTIIAGVRMLEPGCYERYEPGRPLEQRKFREIPPYRPWKETLDESAHRLRNVLEESVALHAFADAPVGAFLSGGVDSTGIVSLMRKHVGELRTYTLKFPDVAFDDEAELAAEAAKALDCRSTIVEVRNHEVPQILLDFAAATDQPSHDGLNTWLVSRAAARDVKAVLSGIGGDEWFAGYPVARRMAYYSSHPLGRAKACLGQVANAVYPWLPEGKLRQRGANMATRRSPLATWLHAHTIFPHNFVQRMLGRRRGQTGEIEKYELLLEQLSPDARRETALGIACLLDIWVYMGSQLLRDSDVMSMAHSLELRTPFLDLNLVDFARTCSDDFKLVNHRGWTRPAAPYGAKRVLLRALADVLPPGIGSRPKRGFALPLQSWLRNELRPLVEETCSLESIRRRGLIDPALIAPLVRTRETIEANLYPRLWALMLLELWCRAVLDAPALVNSARQ